MSGTAKQGESVFDGLPPAGPRATPDPVRDALAELLRELRADKLGIADAMPHFKTVQKARAALAAAPARPITGANDDRTASNLEHAASAAGCSVANDPPQAVELAQHAPADDDAPVAWAIMRPSSKGGDAPIAFVLQRLDEEGDDRNYLPLVPAAPPAAPQGEPHVCDSNIMCRQCDMEISAPQPRGDAQEAWQSTADLVMHQRALVNSNSDLTPDERAWCEATATRLEAQAAQIAAQQEAGRALYAATDKLIADLAAANDRLRDLVNELVEGQYPDPTGRLAELIDAARAEGKGAGK